MESWNSHTYFGPSNLYMSLGGIYERRRGRVRDDQGTEDPAAAGQESVYSVHCALSSGS